MIVYDHNLDIYCILNKFYFELMYGLFSGFKTKILVGDVFSGRICSSFALNTFLINFKILKVNIMLGNIKTSK